LVVVRSKRRHLNIAIVVMARRREVTQVMVNGLATYSWSERRIERVRSRMKAASRAPSRVAARTRSGRTSRLKATTHFQLAGWKSQGEDAPVENCGEHELRGVLIAGASTG
jgi:hypothetical protein